LANDSQPDATSFVRYTFLSPESHIRTPNPAAIHRRDPWTLIFDSQPRAGIHAIDDEPDGLARRAELERVVEQVQHDLSHRPAVDARNHRFANLGDQVRPALL